MTQKASASIAILIVLIVISLSLAGGGFYLYQKERATNLELQDKIQEITTKQRITENRLEESKKSISDLQLKLQEAKLQMNTLSNDLQQEKTARLEAQNKIEQLRVDLEQQKGLRSDLEKKLNQAQDDVRKTQAQLKQLESQKTELEVKVKELQIQPQGVELGKIVVSPETAPSKSAVKATQIASEKKEKKPTALEGKVLVVNKDYNFVVINLGSKDGVGLGNVFSLYHNNKYLGDVKIEKIHDSMAAAGFVSGDIKDKVNEGDKVVQKVK